jgi:hypothetical protein
VEIKDRNRYFPNFEIDLGQLLEYSKITIEKNQEFYRARLNENGIINCNEMGMPHREFSISGRGNPQGIPYLYLASSVDTAVAEIKPYKTAEITIGVFIIKEDLHIADVTYFKLNSPFDYRKDLECVEIYQPLVDSLSIELMKPVNPNKTDLDYIPKQFLCEKIKSLGFEGLKYWSYSGDSDISGDNVLLFNESKVECIKTYKIRVDNIIIEYKNIENDTNDTRK